MGVDGESSYCRPTRASMLKQMPARPRSAQPFRLLAKEIEDSPPMKQRKYSKAPAPATSYANVSHNPLTDGDRKESKELTFRGKAKVDGPPPSDSAGLGSGKAFHSRERPVKGGDYKHNAESEVTASRAHKAFSVHSHLLKSSNPILHEQDHKPVTTTYKPQKRIFDDATKHTNHATTIEGMCAASYKEEPNHYPPRPRTASTETSLATSMRVLNLGPDVPSTVIRPASGKRRITRGRSEGDGVISYDFAGGLRTSSQFEDVRPWYGASSVASRPQTARPATLSKAEAIAKVANGEYQRNKLRNSCNNIFG